MSQKIEYYIWHSNKLWLYDFSENAYVLYDKTEDIIQQFEYPLLWCGHDYKWHKLFTWGSQNIQNKFMLIAKKKEQQIASLC